MSRDPQMGADAGELGAKKCSKPADKSVADAVREFSR